MCGHGFLNRMRSAEMFSKYAWVLYIWCHQKSAQRKNLRSLVRMKTKRRKRNKALQTKTTGKEQIIKIKGKRAALRSACMDFCGASMQLQLLHNLKANPNH
jgi:hypothetical protein